MAKTSKIRADANAAETGKKAARAKADAHFKKPSAKAAGEKVGAELKTTVQDMELGLASKGDYAHHLKAIMGWQSKLEEIKGHLRNAKKVALEANVDPDHIKDALYWSKRDALEFKRYLAGMMRACQVAGMQTPEFRFTDEGSLSLEEKAQQEGHRAGLAGHSYSANPHDPNSDLGRIWEDFRMRGQKEIVGKMGGQGDEPPAAAAGNEQTKPLFEEDDEEEVAKRNQAATTRQLEPIH